MESRVRTALSLFALLILAFSFVQVIPVAKAVSAAPEAANNVPLPGFKLVGQVPDSALMQVSLAIPLRNTAELSSLVRQVSDPTSTLYRHFLSQGQIAQEFLPGAQYQSLMQYISTTGLKVESTSLESVVMLEGTAAQVRQYLGTNIDLYSNGKASYYMARSGSFDGAYLYATNATALFMKPQTSLQSSVTGNSTFTSAAFSAKLLQRVYNATGLYSQGFNGTGKAVGLLDFYGSPTITSDLKAFDKQFGFPDPSFSIVPIGPYDPNLGAATGWSTEISLDVEVSHAMAPGASVYLYVGNGAISLVDAISTIVSLDQVNSVSQSFTYPEWLFSYLPAPVFVFNAFLPDYYYMLGNLEGITFSGSTGDSGGSGFTNGVEGNLGYPATSPYVTGVGGTQTYFSGTGFVQTAWSNIGFVPNFFNEGGSTGGVSILEPVPWYQVALPPHATMPEGRQNPDLSLQGGVDPGTYIVDSGSTFGEGGTSESSPLFAGLVAVMDQAVGGNVGLLNPFLYSLYSSATRYDKAFSQVTFGYNVPWVTGPGYNLVTGLGSPNFGELASMYAASSSSAGLKMNVTLLSAGVDATTGLEFTPGTILSVGASVLTASNTPVTTGSFFANLVTLNGATYFPLAYNSTLGMWTGTMVMGDQSGIAFVNVNGTSGGSSVTGFTEVFAGYMGTFYSPLPTDPWSTIGGLFVAVQSTTLDGTPAINQTAILDVESYSIRTNAYSNEGTSILLPYTDPSLGPASNSTLVASYPTGPTTLVLQGASYGYLPFMNGIYLQNAEIFPSVVAEPGSVAPGQSLTIIESPIAPLNLYNFPSYETGSTFGLDVSVGSNVTAMLVSPSGSMVSTGHLAYQSCAEALRACGNGAFKINGYLTVPSGSPQGLYTILLTANYSSYTIGTTVDGSFYSQVWVTGNAIVPSISVQPGWVSSSAAAGSSASSSTSLYEGEQAHIVAHLAYASGSPILYGEYTATIYPSELADQYTFLQHTAYANGQLTQLAYSPSLGAWVGNITLPSPYNSGSLSLINGNSFYYAGPYDAYVTGISYDGSVTTNALSAQQPFYIQPYVYMSGQVISSLQQNSQLALENDNITASGSLTGDVFLGNNTINGGNVAITDSQIVGTLNINGAIVSLTGVTGGDVSATGSQLVFKDSTISTLTLSNSHVTLSDSSYSAVNPAAPSISVNLPTTTQSSGSLNLNVQVSGQGVDGSFVQVWMDGVAIPFTATASSSGASGTLTLNVSTLADGIHPIIVTASQTDGISATFTGHLTTNAQATLLVAELTASNQLINSLSAQLKDTNASLSSQLKAANTNLASLAGQLGTANSNASTQATYLDVVAVLAVVGIAIAALAIWRSGGARRASGA